MRRLDIHGFRSLKGSCRLEGKRCDSLPLITGSYLGIARCSLFAGQLHSSTYAFQPVYVLNFCVLLHGNISFLTSHTRYLLVFSHRCLQCANELRLSILLWFVRKQISYFDSNCLYLGASQASRAKAEGVQRYWTDGGRRFGRRYSDGKSDCTEVEGEAQVLARMW